MISSHYIEILKSFSEEEFNRLEDFLNSPYHNKNSTVIKLFLLIKKYYPEFDSPKLEREKIYIKLYPGKKYNDQVFRNLISDSIKVFLNFLKTEKFNSSKFISEESLLTEANNRVLDNTFRKTLKIINDEFFSHGNISTDYFNFRRTVENNLFSFEIVRGHQERTSEYINNLLDYGFYDFLVKYFDKFFDLKINEYVYNKKSDISELENIISGINFDKVLKKIKSKSETDFKVLQILYLVFKCISDLNDDESYFSLKKIYKENYSLFARETSVIITNRMESICILKGIHGKKEFMKEEFDVMKFAIENKLHKKENSFMDITRFRNIFNRALSLGETNWAEEFINNHINELKEEFREDLKNYFKAMMSFHKKAFDESQQYLNNMKLNKFIFNLDYRRLMLMIYYEKKDFISAKNLSESFKNFIYKNKNVSDTRKKNLINFINDLNSLIYSAEGNKSALEDLEIRLKADKKIMNREWLIQKISELKN